MPDLCARTLLATVLAVGASLSAFAPAAFGDATARDPESGAAGRAPVTLALDGLAETGTQDDAFRWSLEAAWKYGPIDGQLQTPTGGMPGTTTVGRPTLEELGLDYASIFAAEASFGAGAHEFYFYTQLNRLYGDVTLEETFMSQGRTFPAGSRVHSDVKLDLYRLGYRHRIETGSRRDGAPQFFLYPSAGIAIFAFDMQLDGDGGAYVDRPYAKGAPEFGLGFEWLATDQLTVTGEVTSTFDLSKLPLIVTAKIEGKYMLVRSRGVTVSGTVGVGYQLIRYDDGHKQEMPNDIEVDLGPVVLLGIDVRF